MARPTPRGAQSAHDAGAFSVTRTFDAAILLIGNELLSGRVLDENFSFLARELWGLGVRVGEGAIVPDEVDRIADAIRTLSGRYHWLFTAGGIGPTHDDVSVEGAARAFGVPVVEHEVLASRIRARFGAEVTPSHLRMARVPRGALLESGGESAWPTIRMDNTFLLPGVPSILRRKFEQIRHLFAQAPFHREVLEFVTEEARIAEPLSATAAEHPLVEFGSYPVAERVLVTLESRDRDALDEALGVLEVRLAHVPRSG